MISPEPTARVTNSGEILRANIRVKACWLKPLAQYIEAFQANGRVGFTLAPDASAGVRLSGTEAGIYSEEQHDGVTLPSN